MNYTIHQLQIYLKVVQKSSVTRASEELFMTQPAVSIQLKKFQEQFDLPLTEVVGRQLYVTDFGKEIAVIAERVLEEVKEITYKSNAFKGLLTGNLKVSATSTGKYVIPFFLSGFLEKHTGIDLVLDVTNKSLVIESLKNNEVDFALVSVVPDDLHMEEELLIDNKLYLIGSDVERNQNRPLIYREEGSATRVAMETYFDTYQNKKRKQMQLTSNEAVKQAVVAGLGYSVMPLIGLQNELINKQLHVYKEKDLPIVTQWRLVWLRGKKLSPIASAFLEFVRKNKSEILEKKFKWYLEY